MPHSTQIRAGGKRRCRVIISVITIGSFLFNTVFFDAALTADIIPAEGESSHLRPLATGDHRASGIAGDLSDGLTVTAYENGQKVEIEVTSLQASQALGLQRAHDYTSRIVELKRSIESRGGEITPLSDIFKSVRVENERSGPLRQRIEGALFDPEKVRILTCYLGYEFMGKAFGRYDADRLFLAYDLKVIEALLVTVHEIWHGEMQKTGKGRKRSYSLNEENSHRAEFRLGNNYLDIALTLREAATSVGKDTSLGDYLVAYADELELGVLSLRYLAIASNMFIFADRIRGKEPNPYNEQAAKAVDEIREPVIDTDLKAGLERLSNKIAGFKRGDLDDRIKSDIDRAIMEQVAQAAVKEIEAAKALGPRNEREVKLIKEVLEKERSRRTYIVKKNTAGDFSTFKQRIMTAAEKKQDSALLDKILDSRAFEDIPEFSYGITIQGILEALLSKVTDPAMRRNIVIAAGILMIGGNDIPYFESRKQAGMALCWYSLHQEVRGPEKLNPLVESLLFTLAQHPNSRDGAIAILEERATGSADDFNSEEALAAEGAMNTLFLLASRGDREAVEILKKAAKCGVIHKETKRELRKIPFTVTIEQLKMSNRQIRRIRYLAREALKRLKGRVEKNIWSGIETFLRQIYKPAGHAAEAAGKIETLISAMQPEDGREADKIKETLGRIAETESPEIFSRFLDWFTIEAKAANGSRNSSIRQNPPCIYVNHLRQLGMPEALIRFITANLADGIMVIDRPWEVDIPGLEQRAPLLEIDGMSLNAPPLLTSGREEDDKIKGSAPTSKMSSSGQKQAPVNPIRPLIENPALGSFIESFLTKRYSSWGLAEDLAERILNTLKSYAEDPELARHKIYEEVIDFETDRDWQIAYDRYKEATKYTTTYSQIKPFIENLREGAVIVDAGCGNNALGKEIASANPDKLVMGSDPYDYHEEYDLSNLKFKWQSDPKKLPFKKNYADVVIMNAALHHVEEPDEFLAEIKRVLKPGGRLILVEDTYSSTLTVDNLVIADDEVDTELTKRFLELVSEYGEDFARDFFTFIDWYGNIAVHKWTGMATPYDFHSMESWEKILKERGFILTRVRHMGFPKSSFHKPNTGVMVFMSLESTDLPVFRPEDGHKRTLAISQAA